MSSARAALRVDALFEFSLAALVLLPAAFGVDMGDELGMDLWVALAIGGLLVPVGLGLWLADPTPPTLVAVAAANAAGGVLFAAYLAVRAEALGALGVGLVAAAAAGVLLLAAIELALARDGAGHEATARP